MIKLEDLTPYGRKQWTKKKYDDYTSTPVAKVIERAQAAYSDPVNERFKEKIELSKWHSTVNKKVNYLLARKPVAQGYQEELDSLSDFIKASAREYLLRGSLIWVVQGDGEAIEKKPLIMNKTIAVYTDESKETPLAFIRKYSDIEVQPETGAEETVEYYELYYGENLRDTYCFTKDVDVIGEVLEDAPVFIELGKTGDAPLYAYVERLLCGIDKVYKHQDTSTEANTDPIVEVRGYSGTDDADLEDAVNRVKIVKTDGTGGLSIHHRTMDSQAIDLWHKALLQEYYEATCTVGKENELAYAQSGKALDRLFIDMEADAKDIAHVLEQALKAYFSILGIDNFDIIWNTDKPVNDTEIISGIAASTGILSQKTLIEQHPWVEDVDEELKRLDEEHASGMEDLVDTDLSEYEEEV